MDPIRLRGPADVLAALPYQLGYHPQDCLVAVALHDRRVGLVARIDLPASGEHEELTAAASSATGPLVRERPDSVLLVGYESVVGQSTPLLDAVDACLAAAALTVADRLVVRQGRWYSSDCEEDDCCPLGGTLLPDPSEVPAVADFVALGRAPLPQRAALASLVAPDAGVCRAVAAALRRRAAPSGAAFGLPLSAVLDVGREELERRVAVQRLQWLSLWRAVCDIGSAAVPVEALGPAEVAELVASLKDVQLRDGLIAWLCPGTLPLESLPEDLVDQLRSCLPQRPWHSGTSARRPRAVGSARAASATSPSAAPTMSARGASAKATRAGTAEPASPRDDARNDITDNNRDDTVESVVAGRRLLGRLQWLVRAVPDPEAAAVLTVAANVAWWLGDGTLARMALDRALDHEPSYRLAQLLDHMVGLGLRPGPEGATSRRR